MQLRQPCPIPSAPPLTVIAVDRREVLSCERVCDVPSEFPVCATDGVETRFAYSVRFSGREVDGMPTLDGVVKTDLRTGATTVAPFPNRALGDCAFVPRPGGVDEDDGWLITTSFDLAGNDPRIELLDALRPEDGPVARIGLPEWWAPGLHCLWVPGQVQ